MGETNLLELSAYCLRAWALAIASQWQAQLQASKAPSTRLLHAHTSRAALGLLHLPALPTMYKSAPIGL
jgi:hypothetical protein